MKKNTHTHHILFIATSPLYLEKGSSLRSYAILNILANFYHVDVVTYSLGREFRIDNVDVYRTPGWFKPRLSVGNPTVAKLLLDFFIWLKVIRLSLSRHYHVIHCEDFEGLAIGCLSKFLNKRSHLVYDLHNRILDNLHLKKEAGLFDRVLLFLEKSFVGQTDKIIVNWAKYLTDNLFIHHKKFLYYDPIDPNVEPVDLPAENYLIYSGNFEDYQGLQNFIPVFAKLSFDMKLVLVGSPSEKIKNLIRTLNVEDRVILTGRLSVSQTNYIIKHAMAGILPRIRGASMKVLHYFFWGKPVIAKNTPSNRELIKDDINGFLYASDQELTDKIIRLISLKDANTMFCNGLEKTKAHMSAIWDMNRFMEEYEK